MSISDEFLGADRDGTLFILAAVVMHGLYSGNSRYGLSDMSNVAFDQAESFLAEFERRKGKGKKQRQ